jgi:hypothetical protein
LDSGAGIHVAEIQRTKIQIIDSGGKVQLISFNWPEPGLLKLRSIVKFMRLLFSEPDTCSLKSILQIEFQLSISRTLNPLSI